MAKSKNTLSPELELTDIEAQLAGTLKPVAPPRDIVNRLRLRLRIPNRAEINSRLSNWRRLFVVFGGVMSGMLLLITLARMFYYLTGRKVI